MVVFKAIMRFTERQMRDLKLFTSDGREYNQIKVFDLIPNKRRIALYSVFSQHTPTIIGYEVVILRFSKQKKRVFRNKEISFKEGYHYPSNEEFGKYGWFFTHKNYAEAKFLAILRA